VRSYDVTHFLLCLRRTKTLYTDRGLRQLAEIIKQERGRYSDREFESLTQVSHATVRCLELCEVKNPEDSTLIQIAPQTAYSYDKLKAIAQERDKGDVREYRIAEDVFPMVGQLPTQEKARLAQMIVGDIGGL
jgi:hypothetical protein